MRAASPGALGSHFSVPCRIRRVSKKAHVPFDVHTLNFKSGRSNRAPEGIGPLPAQVVISIRLAGAYHGEVRRTILELQIIGVHDEMSVPHAYHARPDMKGCSGSQTSLSSVCIGLW